MVVDAAFREALAGTILDGTTEGILSVDDAGVVRSCNPAAERAFGWLAADIIGQPVARLTPGPDQRRRGDQVLSPTVHESRSMAAVGLRKDGSRFPMELVIAPFVVEGRRHATWFVRDVTERAQLEAQLRQSQKMDAMGQLAGGVAHDFNNLLTVINGWCETLGSESTEERRCAVDQITHAANRAATLTGQLLAFGRKAVVSPRVVDLNDIIDDVAKMLGRVIGEDIELDIRPAPTPQHVRIDTGQMGQVLVNLAVNARDAMPRGGRLTITTGASSMGLGDARSHGLDPGAYVCLRVTDTGIGMSPEVANRVFEPFYTTKGEKGTGLGLATVYGIVRQAGGTIFVRSRPGEGAAFSILLPAVPREQQELEVPVREQEERGTETILIVEDEPQVRAIAVSMLRSRGYHVLVAGGSDDALTVARANPGVQLVVTDVVMPGKSGPELVTELRELRPEIPVLYVSGYAADAVLESATGQAAFLQKPYTGHQLALRVREVLERRGQTVPAMAGALVAAGAAGRERSIP